MPPKVSVIIPIYNTEKYLRQCLDTIITQTLQDIEIICVDDGSTDKSLEILLQYQKKDERIVILTQQNKGGGAARNAGLKAARGEFLLFLDSDDFFEEHMLEKSYDKGKTDGADIVIFASKSYSEKKKRMLHAIAGVPKKAVSTIQPFNQMVIPDHLFSVFLSTPWNKFYRADFVRKNDLWFQELYVSNDVLFVCISLAIAERISVLNNVFVYYRVDMSKNCQANLYKHPFATYQANVALRERLLELNVYDKVETSYLNRVTTGSIRVLSKLKSHPEEHELLYTLLQSKGFDTLGVTESNQLKITEKRAYNYCMVIKKTPYSAFTRTNLISKLHYGFYHYYLMYQIPSLLHDGFAILREKGYLHTFSILVDKINV
ncbi:glycosyltransferase family 2 protein [Methanocorpusculum parvum]|uniref:Glycosyltransferase 2-like domain-containing protein n=1 Tax=Methanocorpusculum parvum TaxID=2193 RepID=A0AAX0Q7V7_9EURY|nr:glycosyltransferase family 2 protein [Methanocorpusculum parvum]PAV09386.1 hypothetical protein ASJ83_07895 [Methanocorpusculum parvum]